MPPFAFQALVRAEARSQETAQGFLNEAAALATDLPGADQVTVFPAVPMTIQRVANVERAQMLLESPTRVALQRFLAAWQPVLLSVAVLLIAIALLIPGRSGSLTSSTVEPLPRGESGISVFRT